MFSKGLVTGLLLALPAQVFAMVLHESIETIPSEWAQVGTPSADTTINLEAAVVLSNIDQMVEALYAVSTPGGASYGQHWSADQVNNLVAASNQSILATVGWLTDSNITSTVTGSSVKFSTTVGQAEQLLNTTFNYYQRNGAGAQVLRTTGYSLPAHVGQHVDFLHPTTYFGQVVAHAPTKTSRERFSFDKRQTSVNPSCSTGLTPDCVHQLYDIPVNYKPNLKSGASIGFGSFLNQSSQESDLLLFEQHFGIKNQTFNVVLINGGTNDQNGTTAQDGEANLDAQNIVGVAHGLPVTEFITGGSPPWNPDLNEPLSGGDENEPYLQYYQYLLAQPNEALPQVITNSYGDDEQTVPKKYATRVCNMIGMMGLRGITILESSGDTGIGADCQSNTKKPKPTFIPTFPGTCPYITAVGGTQNIPEIAWVGSSGGFSNYFPRPSYQEYAVDTYLNKHVTSETAVYYSQFTNFSGRGFPDVAAMSVSPFYYGYYDGQLARNGGTSAASPVFAGVIGLLNAARMHAGKPALGFLNPWIYSNPTVLRDITGGQSQGCNGVNEQSGANTTAPVIPYAFWNATVGWDPVTGFGVPDFEKMLNATLST